VTAFNKLYDGDRKLFIEFYFLLKVGVTIN